MKLSQKEEKMAKFVILDTETTGTDEKDRIIELGFMVLGRANEPIEVYNEFCMADVPIKFEAMEVHGITPEMIEGKALCRDLKAFSVLNELNQSDNFLIIHNAPFDLGMLEKEQFINKMKLIDTLRCSKHLFKDSPYHRLQYHRYAMGLYQEEQALAAKLGIELKAHDAIGDVLVLKLFVSKLVEAVKKAYGSVDVMQKLVELTQTPVFIEVWNFGKHKGRRLEELAKEDPSYLRWALDNMSVMDEDLRYSVNKVLGQ